MANFGVPTSAHSQIVLLHLHAYDVWHQMNASSHSIEDPKGIIQEQSGEKGKTGNWWKNIEEENWKEKVCDECCSTKYCLVQWWRSREVEKEQKY